MERTGDDRRQLREIATTFVDGLLRERGGEKRKASG